MTPLLYPSNPVLIIDDETIILKSYELSLRTGGINNILPCQDSRNVLSIIAERNVTVILLDLSMPYISGEEMLLNIKNKHPDIPVIIITGDNDVSTAVSCMKKGAADYMVKPVEKSRLVSGVRRAIEIRELQNEVQMLKDRMLTGTLARPEAFSGMITNNRAMLSLFQYAEAIAGSPQPVLITGETGVGKELMARAVHKLSGRTGKFISVNSSGIDDNVFADTLFGHVKGAFTGADQIRAGIVENASGGTLVLDEIGDLNMASQIKLLRLIQEGEYLPLGSDIPKTTDTRIIVSTNKDLQALQKSGQFRTDLYFRLKAHHIHLPPLRDRCDDIPLLMEYFLEEAARSLEKDKPSYPDELITLLTNYHFPGNIRELYAMLYDALSTHKSKLLSTKRFQSHMDQERLQTGYNPPPNPSIPHASIQFSGTLPTLKQATVNLITEAMRRTNNNQSMAARLLGISRQTLARHLSAGAK
jgi:DNA-binding NtrC family response regulator